MYRNGYDDQDLAGFIMKLQAGGMCRVIDYVHLEPIPKRAGLPRGF